MANSIYKNMSKDEYFSSIRPYNDDELQDIFTELLAEESFRKVLSNIFPDTPLDGFEQHLRSITNVADFQKKVVYPYVKKIADTTSQGISFDGLDKLDPNKGYVFISNHRDITLDSTFMNKVFIENGRDTVEIAIGDNLLIYPWISKVVKLNKSFIVKRNLPARQMLASSKVLSEYIRYARTEKNSSIWIAQREGRSKDGDDRTQSSLLKMINMSGENSFAENFKEIQIVPVAISYELDPCDYLKAQEFYLKSQDPEYKKTPADDLKHMQSGINGRKGRIHYSFGTPIANELESIEKLGKNERLEELASTIDEQIHNNYKLWPGNFIASDLMNKENKFADKYTTEDLKWFENYMEERIARVEGDTDFVKNTLLEMYSNPVKNFYQE